MLLKKNPKPHTSFGEIIILIQSKYKVFMFIFIKIYPMIIKQNNIALTGLEYTSWVVDKYCKMTQKRKR